MARYITTTLPYVNADPHIGFAVEILQADVLTRTWRSEGEDVFFTTGTDEHGQKIWEAAQKKGQDVQEYVDHYANEFKKLANALGLDNPTFVRTTDAHHVRAAQKMWELCAASGDIYKQKYSGLYCVGCEAFKTEHEVVDGACMLHPNLELQTIEEENYFFALSKYQDRLLAYLDSPETILPEWRREEARAFVARGLEDFSISREAHRLSWGVPVPGDDSQVMYVWFDALTNYLSTLGWPEDTGGSFKKFWEDGQVLQVAGKDQVRFQSIMWQAMLMSAGIKNTDQVFYHGFVTSGGQKMSKSLGNVINPYELIAKYGTEATRYLLLRHVHPTEDSDVTWERLDEWYTANMVNGLGNLVARVMKLAELYLTPGYQNTKPVVSDTLSAHLGKFEFNQALDLVFEQIALADKKITETEPFKVIKTDPEQATKIIIDLILDLYVIGNLLKPFMPATASEIISAIENHKKPENLFPRLS